MHAFNFSFTCKKKVFEMLVEVMSNYFASTPFTDHRGPALIPGNATDYIKATSQFHFTRNHGFISLSIKQGFAIAKMKLPA